MINDLNPNNTHNLHKFFGKREYTNGENIGKYVSNEKEGFVFFLTYVGNLLLSVESKIYGWSGMGGFLGGNFNTKLMKSFDIFNMLI